MRADDGATAVFDALGRLSYCESHLFDAPLIYNDPMTNDKSLNPHELPYPLPPWRHRFRTLSVFCEVDASVLAPLVPKPLTLGSNIVQITVMYFESSVPTRPYYDLSLIHI